LGATKQSEFDVPTTATQGFSQKVLRYFLTFLQTDFKKQQAPRRRINMKSEAGFRMAMPLRKYAALYRATWKLAATAPEEGLQFKISHGQYKAPINPTLRDLVRQRVDAIPDEDFAQAAARTIAHASERRSQAIQHPERYVESIQVHFVEQIGERIVQPLLALLEGPFKDAAYSAVESIYDVEADLTETIAARALESLPSAINSLVVSGNSDPMRAVFTEFLGPTDVRARIQIFFDDFATSDAFQEMRDLLHSLRSTENQALYLYLCEIKFGPHAFPLFYIPASLDYKDDTREFLLEFDPHLLVNKQAVDWILQERETGATSVQVSPIPDRVVYLDGKASFVDEMRATRGRHRLYRPGQPGRPRTCGRGCRVRRRSHPSGRRALSRR
jgi:hypothetical protein